MLDLKQLRHNPEELEKKLQTKEPSVSLGHILPLDERIREIKTEVEFLKSERNNLSKQIGELKRKGENVDSLMEQVGGFGEQIAILDKELQELEPRLEDLLARLPNLPFDNVKISQDPKDNEVIAIWGEKPTFSFTPKNHLELNEKLHLFDFKRGAKVTGTGWPVYVGIGARLEWALIQYMMQIHISNGFTPYMLPHCVKAEALYGSGQLPKFAEQSYKLNDPDYPFYLIPTSEVALNGLLSGEILNEEELPKRCVAYTPCFRREAGAAGSQERGLIRIHQFNKVEMFAFTTPEDSPRMHEEMLRSAEQILEGLQVHYRHCRLVTGDMSFAAALTVDVECWLPGQNRYYEVSSVSNCTDFQARRSLIRYRKGQDKPEFVHTLNGSGLATPRLMVAILENNQQADGSVVIPKVLRPYLDGQEILLPTEAPS